MRRFMLQAVTTVALSGLGISSIGAVAHSVAADGFESRSSVRPNAKCEKVLATVTVVVKGVTLQCRKGKKGHFWRVVKTTTPSTPSPGPLQTLRVVPEGSNNAFLTMNQRFAPEIAQTFTVSEPIQLESLILDPRCITSVPLSYYSGQNQDHSLEQFTCNSPDIETTVTTSLYRLGADFTGNPARFRIAQTTEVTKDVQTMALKLERPFAIGMSAPTRLDPGYYAVVFGFQLSDPTVNTIWFGAHQHNEGPQPPCVTEPATDVFALGSAYRGEPENDYTGLADNFRGFSDLFVMHTAKVQSCIAVGNYGGDVFANGDLNLQLQYRDVRS